ncbi:serum response factor homolog A [Drosophila eugracilis]|uniref:serum response factor homolog A n=1 Tax=Drosophila eugracilis TaxID=29029 RepID=UPI0007E68CAB|nr:serum response factor homolog A [Drosophila eugracilis]
MKLYAPVILLACCLLVAQAAPEKKIAQKSRQVEQDAKVGVASAAGSTAGSASKDPSSGRLFLKKFLTFKNLFSSNNQPVIPIIITGAGTGTSTGTSPTSPTVTVTSTGTIPSATGTITTSPTTPSSPTSTSTGRQTIVKGARYGSDDEAEDQEQEKDQEQEQDQELAQGQMPAQAYPAELMDEQALQAALAAGAQEYEVVTTGHEVQGTGGATGEGGKATQSNNHISLRRKGARRGQVISVRIPPRYRRYFKNGQKVMLNTGSRPGSKRRVVRKRVPAKKINKNNRRRNGNKKNRRNRNKNRRNRITAV